MEVDLLKLKWGHWQRERRKCEGANSCLTKWAACLIPQCTLTPVFSISPWHMDTLTGCIFLNFYFLLTKFPSNFYWLCFKASRGVEGGELYWPSLLNYSRAGLGEVGAAVRTALSSQTIVICINHIARECKGSKSLSACRDGCFGITCYRSERL